jgi:hypothetical protein
MAIDQTEKRRAVARDAAALSPMLMDTLYRLDALRARRNNGGPGGTALAFVDTDFTGEPGLKHIDTAMINAFFAAVPTLLTAFVNQNFDDVFEAMRP